MKLARLDNHFCRISRSLLLGSFSHYGATGPPYWTFAYPLPPWRANTTLEGVDLRHNAITHIGLTALVEALEASRGIGVFKVQGNPAAASTELLERLRAAVAHVE